MKFSVSEISELVRHRRTIYPKDYSDRVVHREMVERILSNGTWAPTHGMTQPWRFTVFTGESRMDLSDFLAKEYRRITPEDSFQQRKFENITQRPLLTTVVVAVSMVRDPRGRIRESDEMLAVACAVQNMHLTCAAYGLGAFWATADLLTGDAMRNYLGLGPEDKPMGLFYIGYPSVEWPKGYRQPLDQVVTWKED